MRQVNDSACAGVVIVDYDVICARVLFDLCLHQDFVQEDCVLLTKQSAHK